MIDDNIRPVNWLFWTGSNSKPVHNNQIRIGPKNLAGSVLKNTSPEKKIRACAEFTGTGRSRKFFFLKYNAKLT